MAVLHDVERERLQATDEHLLTFQRTMEEAARSGALGPEQLQRFVVTIKDYAGKVNDQLLPQIDPEAASEISRRLITVLTMDPTQGTAADTADAYLMELEAIRHVLRDLLQEHQPESLRREGRELIGLLEDWLPRVQVADLAELLGLSSRQLQRRRQNDAPSTSREQLVARLVAILRQAWTDEGVVAWFRRPRSDLDGQTPLELLGDPAQEPDLLNAARSGRVQGGV
jgi:AcrR family transcriptional regulator